MDRELLSKIGERVVRNWNNGPPLERTLTPLERTLMAFQKSGAKELRSRNLAASNFSSFLALLEKYIEDCKG
jgi:hypothetical protein